MMRVNPTRMELTRLKRRLKVAARGHKLLKDKRDEMIRRFMALIKENKRLRETVEEVLGTALRDFVLARFSMSPEALEEALMTPVYEVELAVKKQNIMSVNVPVIEFTQKEPERLFWPYGLLSTSAELDGAIRGLSDVLPDMIRLAELEKTCNMLADEIEKTRRRVNALEYVLIPKLEETIRYITMKLDENERSNRTRLMKMKDIIEKRSHESKGG